MREGNSSAAGAAPVEPAAEASAASHTPGPWRADRNDCYWEIKSELHGQIGDACASKYIFINGVQMPDEEAEHIAAANARLMAAAPDLLDVLQEIVDYRGGADSALHDEYVMERVHAAIAKAEGQK